jgi:hypothetical protein
MIAESVGFRDRPNECERETLERLLHEARRSAV